MCWGLMFAKHGELQGKMPICVSITTTHGLVHTKLAAAEERALLGFLLLSLRKLSSNEGTVARHLAVITNVCQETGNFEAMLVLQV